MMRRQNLKNHGPSGSRKLPLKWIYATAEISNAALVLLGICLVLSSVLSVAVAYVLKLFVDIASGTSVHDLSYAVWITLGVLLASCVFSIFGQYLKTVIFARSEMVLRTKLVKNLLGGSISAGEMQKGEILSRCSADVQVVANFIPDFLYQVVGNLFLIVFSIVSLFLLSPAISGILIVGLPLLVLILAPLNVPIGKSDVARKQAEDASIGSIEEGISNVSTLIGNRHQNAFLQHVQSLLSRAVACKIRFGIWEGLAGFFNQLMGTLMILVVLGVGAYFVLQGKTTLGTLIAMVQLLNYLVGPINEIATYLSKAAQVVTSKERLMQILGAKAHEHTQMDPTPTGEVFALVVSDVGYRSGEKMIFDHFTHRFSRGKLYCIVGENGAGKTTLLKLLATVLAPKDGTLAWEDGSGQLHSLSSVATSVQFAEETPYTGTVAQNITVFQNTTCIRENTWAMRFLAAGNTPLSLERAVDKQQHLVSIGEMRKISLARVATHDADLYLFDEPSANLDMTSKAMLIDFLQLLCSQQKIVVVVTHDEDLIHEADEVVRL